MRLSTVLLLIALLGSTSFGPTCVAATTSTEEERIRVLVEQLGAKRFAVREAATQQLIELGPGAIEMLAAKLPVADIETSLRGLDVLHELALRDSNGAARAESAIRKLASGRITSISQRADEVLRSLLEARTARGIKALRRLGAVISFVPATADEKSLGTDIVFVTLAKAWKGDLNDMSFLDWLADHKGVQVKFQGDRFDDKWLKRVAELNLVVSLQLNRTTMTDAGLGHLASMKRLQGMSIRYCKFSDDSMQYFDQLNEGMRFLSVFGSGISRPAFEELAKRRPAWNTRYGRGGFLGIGGSGYENNGIKGCIVSTVTPNQAANLAGIREFDIILAYNGQEVSEFVPPIRGGEDTPDSEKTAPPPSLSELIGRNAPGDKVQVTILRSGEKIEKDVVLGEWP